MGIGVQDGLAPPGSCSIALTAGHVDSEPGSLKGIEVNVDDADDAHAFLRDRGVEVSEIQTFPWGLCRADTRCVDCDLVFADRVRPLVGTG